MMLDLQKASVLKRASAWLLDVILLLILVVGICSGLSALLGVDQHSTDLEAHYARYETEYGVKFSITQEEYAAMTEEGRANYDAAYEALIADKEAMYSYNMVLNLTLIVVSIGILLGYLILEFAVPMFLGNGQTVGKKIFGLGVMRVHGVKMNGVAMFIRTLLGKYTLETMIPVLVVIMLMFNVTGLMGTLLVLGIGIAQIIMMIVTRTNSTIHDLLADCVVVDLSSQLIFDTEEELLEYKKRMSAENAAQQSYF